MSETSAPRCSELNLAVRVAHKLMSHAQVTGVVLVPAEDDSKANCQLHVFVSDEEADLFRRVATHSDDRQSYAELNPLYRKQFGDDGEMEDDTEYALRRLGYHTAGTFYLDIAQSTHTSHFDIVFVGEDWTSSLKALGKNAPANSLVLEF